MDSLEFSVENLEDRRLLAGNVTLDFNNGDAVITGDNSGNELVITDSDGGISIQGVNGTTVEGSTAAQELALPDDLRINLKNGDNRLIIAIPNGGDVIEIEGDLDIRSGNGDDAIWVENVIVHDDLSIRTKGGEDSVQTRFGVVDDEIKINTSGDSDFVRVQGMNVGRANVRTGGGDDMLLFQSATTNKSSINLGGGADHAAIGGFFIDRVSVSGGGGTDTYLEAFVSSNDPKLKSLELTDNYKESTFLILSEFTVGVLTDANDFYSVYAP